MTGSYGLFVIFSRSTTFQTLLSRAHVSPIEAWVADSLSEAECGWVDKVLQPQPWSDSERTPKRVQGRGIVITSSSEPPGAKIQTEAGKRCGKPGEDTWSTWTDLTLHYGSPSMLGHADF
jgi:hypothetical protein